MYHRRYVIIMRYNFGPDENICYAITDAVSDFENCRPRDLVPLQNTIDAEVLEKLFAPQFEGEAYVSFQYSNSYVSVQEALSSSG